MDAKVTSRHIQCNSIIVSDLGILCDVRFSIPKHGRNVELHHACFAFNLMSEVLHCPTYISKWCHSIPCFIFFVVYHVLLLDIFKICFRFS